MVTMTQFFQPTIEIQGKSNCTPLEIRVHSLRLEKNIWQAPSAFYKNLWIFCFVQMSQWHVLNKLKRLKESLQFNISACFLLFLCQFSTVCACLHSLYPVFVSTYFFMLTLPIPAHNRRKRVIFDQSSFCVIVTFNEK